MEQNHTWQETGLDRFRDDYGGILHKSIINFANKHNFSCILETRYQLMQTLAGETLIIRRSENGGEAGTWEFAGGKADAPTEDQITTLGKETGEELGIAIAPHDLIAMVTHHSFKLGGDSIEYVIELNKAIRDIQNRFKIEVYRNLLPLHLIAYRFSIESRAEENPLLYISKIFRVLLKETIPVKKLHLSSEHDAAAWVGLDELESVDWARSIYRDAALSTAALYPSNFEIYTQPGTHEEEAILGHLFHFANNCQKPIRSS